MYQIESPHRVEVVVRSRSVRSLNYDTGTESDAFICSPHVRDYVAATQCFAVKKSLCLTGRMTQTRQSESRYFSRSAKTMRRSVFYQQN